MPNIGSNVSADGGPLHIVPVIVASSLCSNAERRRSAIMTS